MVRKMKGKCFIVSAVRPVLAARQSDRGQRSPIMVELMEIIEVLREESRVNWVGSRLSLGGGRYAAGAIAARRTSGSRTNARPHHKER